MAITTTSYVERVLIVLNEDGSLKGAHQEQLTINRDGSTVINAFQGLPEPLTAGTLASVLPAQTALAAQVQELTIVLAEITAARDAAVATIAERDATIADLEQKLDIIKAEDEATPQALAAYAARKRWELMAAGLEIDGVQIPGDDTAQQRLKAARDYLAEGAIEEPVQIVIGMIVMQASEAQITAIITALAQFTQSLFAKQATAVAGITATPPTITDRAGVDACFA